MRAPGDGDRSAGRLAAAGGCLGALAGLLELTIGPSMRDWVGNKQDTTRLGLTTMLLAAIALVAARALHRRRGQGGAGRVAVALGLLLPALIGFTTVGRLWYVPGPLLLVAGSLVLAGTSREHVADAFTAQHWRAGLVALCGLFYVFLGATALGVAGALGIVGSALIWGSLRAAPHGHRTAYALLLVGAVPFAVATWWSVVTPLVALLALAIGRGVIRRAGPTGPTGPRTSVVLPG